MSALSVSQQLFHEIVKTDPLCKNVWEVKYRLNRPEGTSDERTIADTHERVARAIMQNDQEHYNEVLQLIQGGYLLPAGRIMAGAGANRRTTLMNCYVGATIQDSMPGIQLSIARVALTMQQGGGMGSNFSTIRPALALVRQTGAVASGVIPFMDQQSSMCESIASAGERRGAMMGTLRCDHPDLWNERQFETYIDPHTGDEKLMFPSFISAKRQRNRLTQFNVSVLITDAFMQAVEANDEWDLGFFVPPAENVYINAYKKPFPYDEIEYDNDFNQIQPTSRPLYKKGQMVTWYVYRRVPARRIWQDIMESNYIYAEPGVIYIDRVNEYNNLNYCEEINCANPCAEQPLPEDGCCDLSSINLALMVNEPFDDDATFDYTTFRRAVKGGVRFLDNALDVTNYPLEAQRIESMAKRRIGLGITGFADALLMLRIRYGSKESVAFAAAIGYELQDESYRASALLAKERGSFPLYDAEKFGASKNVARLSPSVRKLIAEHGIRNGVLNTIAPNGTIAITAGVIGAGHEAIFSFEETDRKVRQPRGPAKVFKSVNFAYRLYERLEGKIARADLPDYFVGALELSPDDHVAIHAAFQKWIDASISKTVNCPTTISLEDFQNVYMQAYKMGSKGCTTYRFDPRSGRGSVLSETKQEKEQAAEFFDGADEKNILISDIVKVNSDPQVAPRPNILEGRTYKIKWTPTNANWYVTVNNDGTRPIEVFIVTKEVSHQEWVTALTRTITAVLRRGGDVSFLPAELSAVHAAATGVFLDSRYCPSIVAAIGRVLATEFERLQGAIAKAPQGKAERSVPVPVSALRCPSCEAPAWTRQGGCWVCGSCGHTTCD